MAEKLENLSECIGICLRLVPFADNNSTEVIDEEKKKRCQAQISVWSVHCSPPPNNRLDDLP